MQDDRQRPWSGRELADHLGDTASGTPAVNGLG
jgi:hypothetical protein